MVVDDDESLQAADPTGFMASDDELRARGSTRWHDPAVSARRDELRTAGLWVVAVCLLAVGGLMTCSGHTDARELNQLAHSPSVGPAQVVGGPTYVEGRAVAEDDQLLTAPHTGDDALYYEYREEEYREEVGEETGGDKTWWETDFETATTDFLLVDDEGNEIKVWATDDGLQLPDEDQQDLIDAPLNARDRIGDFRHTERMIAPGDEVGAFGFAYFHIDEPRLGFDRDGDYFPTVTTRDRTTLERERLTSSVGLLLVAIVLLLSIVWLLAVWHAVHHSGLYLLASVLIVTLTLGVPGGWMLAGDIRAAKESGDRVVEDGTEFIDQLLSAHDIDWDRDLDSLGSLDDPRYAELSDDQREQIAETRFQVGRSLHRLDAYLSRFPHQLVRLPMRISAPDLPEMSPDERQRLEQLEDQHASVTLPLPLSLLLVILGIGGAAVGTRRGATLWIEKQLVEDISSPSPADVTYGLTQVDGALHLRDDQGVEAPRTGDRCIQYISRSEQRAEPGSDTFWETIDVQRDQSRFSCRDSSGDIVVDPAETTMQSLNWKTDTRREEQRRFTERRLRPDDDHTLTTDHDVYVLGEARIHPDRPSELMISAPRDETPFVIDGSSREWPQIRQKARQGGFWLALGTVATLMAAIGILGFWMPAGPALFVLSAAVVLAYLAITFGAVYHRHLVWLRERVDRIWEDLDEALARRLEVVENLADIAVEHLDYPDNLDQSVTEARHARRQAGQQPDRNQLDAARRAVDKLVGAIDESPRLQNDQRVEQMLEALRGVDDEIALIQKGYSDIVERYNRRRNRFPEMVLTLLPGCRLPAADPLGEPESEDSPKPVQAIDAVGRLD